MIHTNCRNRKYSILLCSYRSLKVELIGIQGKNYGLVVNDLCGNIVPDQSFVKVL